MSACTFVLPAKKSKVQNKKKVKKTGPNLTGATTDLASDADCDSVLIESGMEPQAGTSGLSGNYAACISAKKQQGTHGFLHYF